MPAFGEVEHAERPILSDVNFRQVVVENFRAGEGNLGRCWLASIEIGLLAVEQRNVVPIIGSLGDLSDQFVAASLGNVDGHVNLGALAPGLEEEQILGPIDFALNSGFAAFGLYVGD